MPEPSRRPVLTVIRPRMRINLAGALAVTLAVVLMVETPASAEPLPDFGTEAIRGTSSSDGSRISDIRVGANSGYDRFVVEFGGPLGSWSVSYVDEVTTNGSGAPVAVEGSAFIQVSVSIGTDDPPTQETIDTGLSGLIQVVDVFEPGPADVVAAGYGLGTAERAGFRAFTLACPYRLVVDVVQPNASPLDGETAAPPTCTDEPPTAANSQTSTEAVAASGDNSGSNDWLLWLAGVIAVFAIIVGTLNLRLLRRR